MKSSRIPGILVFASSLALLASFGCSKSSDNQGTVSQDIKKATDDVKTTAVDSWNSIKDYTFEKRTDFVAAMGRMSDAMSAKVSAMPDAAAKDKAAAIKDYNDASADLKAKLADLGNATSDTWADAKAKVDEAWKKVGAAYDKVTS
jgi:hypothetical protein